MERLSGSDLTFACNPRLKKVQGKKKRDAAAEEERRQAIALEEENAEASANDSEEGNDMLHSKDPDIIF